MLCGYMPNSSLLRSSIYHLFRDRLYFTNEGGTKKQNKYSTNLTSNNIQHKTLLHKWNSNWPFRIYFQRIT